jgi:hypothetical protein
MAVGLAFSMACGAPAVPHGSSGADGHDTGTADPSTTLPLPPDPSATSTTSVSASATIGDDDTDPDEGSVFLSWPDGGDSSFECNIGLQDCEPGFKCMPYTSRDGTMWGASACFPVHPDPAGPGEPCQWEGEPWSGYDDCGWAEVCWTFTGEPGICKGLCLFDEPGGGSVHCEDPRAIPYVGCQSCFCVCEVPCDPLAQDCSDGQECVGANSIFECLPDASGDAGAYGDPCEYINACDPGLACLDASATPGCEGEIGCCSPFCDLTQPNTCPGAAEGQTCQPWYEPGTAPRGLEDVGVCALPR